MARIRADYVFGTVENVGGLAVGDTTLESAKLADLPPVAAPDVAAITLHDDTGAYEIVHVTAHTISATTATIVRAQEGSSAQAWAAGAAWDHALTVEDITSISSAASSIDGLSDVDTTTTTPAVGDSLVWDGANWVPGEPTATTGVQVLDSAIYDPATLGYRESNSSTWTDFAATDLVATFTAPSSGSVMVDLSASTDFDVLNIGSQQFLWWGLRDASNALVANSDARVGRYPTGVYDPRVSYRTIITGLTPGASYTWKWCQRAEGTNTSTQRTLFGGEVGQATMVVMSLPI